MPDAPKKGERYCHRVLRGTWTVRSAGEKQVILDCNIPGLRPTIVPTHGFMKADWERVR